MKRVNCIVYIILTFPNSIYKWFEWTNAPNKKIIQCNYKFYHPKLTDFNKTFYLNNKFTTATIFVSFYCNDTAIYKKFSDIINVFVIGIKIYTGCPKRMDGPETPYGGAVGHSK